MNDTLCNILIVEDNPFDFKLTSKLLLKNNDRYVIEWGNTLSSGIEKLSLSHFHVLLLDLNLPDSKGVETVLTVRNVAPDLPVIVLTSQDDEESAITALKSGAQDYLIKGKIDRALLERSIRYAIERQQTAIHLKSQNDFLMSTIESLTHPFIVVEAEDRSISLANTAARNGWFKENSCCKTEECRKNRPYLCQGQTCPVFTVIDSKTPVVLRHVYLDEKGDSRTNEIHAFPVFKSNGDVKQVIVYILDITESENSKKESQRLGKVVQQSSDSILIMATDQTIEYVNPAFERMTGYSRKELVGKNHGFLLSQKHTLDYFEKIRESLNKGKSWSGVLISRKKDDTLYEEDVVISPVKNDQGEIINFVATSRDITSKKRLESIAEAANLMTNIGYIFSGIRHEIGNPINSIKMALTVLNNNIDTYSIEMIKEFTERSLEEVLRVEYLLKALKNFSMYENLDVMSVNVGECMRNFSSLIRDDFSRKNISIDLQLPTEPVYAMADPRALHQVLLNLATNAVDALSFAKHPVLSLRLEKKVHLAIIYISDNGCGMTNEERSNLFKPFHTTKRNGTGLGLVIVKKMLSSMNSTIKVQSEKNKGTTVILFLPEDNFGHEEKTPVNYR
jgi:PAS domain S-box-containing protein